MYLETNRSVICLTGNVETQLVETNALDRAPDTALLGVSEVPLTVPPLSSYENFAQASPARGESEQSMLTFVCDLPTV